MHTIAPNHPIYQTTEGTGIKGVAGVDEAVDVVGCISIAINGRGFVDLDVKVEVDLEVVTSVVEGASTSDCFPGVGSSSFRSLGIGVGSG